MTAADGSGARPSAARTLARSRSTTSAHAPSAFQRANIACTVCHGGKSPGSARHLTPLSFT